MSGLPLRHRELRIKITRRHDGDRVIRVGDGLLHLTNKVGAGAEVPSLESACVANVFELPRNPLGPCTIRIAMTDEERLALNSLLQPQSLGEPGVQIGCSAKKTLREVHGHPPDLPQRRLGQPFTVVVQLEQVFFQVRARRKRGGKTCNRHDSGA